MKKTLKEMYINEVQKPSPEAFEMADEDWDLARKIDRLHAEMDPEGKSKLIWGWIKNDVLTFEDFAKLLDLWNVKLIY